MRKSICTWLFIICLALLMVECKKTGTESKGILVSTEWLQDQISEADLLVLHSGTVEGYDSIHIPGSRLIIPGQFTLTKDSVRNELPSLDSVELILRKAGVNKDSRIVLCYENERLISRTARIYLTLVHAGLSPRTYVLNGGLPRWLEEERESTFATSDYSMGDVEVGPPVDVLISSSELENKRWSPQLVVLDTRSDEEYRGTPATADQEAEGGHVEGAYFLPYQKSFTDELPYLFKPDAELDKLFAESGMKRDLTTAVYCGSGIRASVSYLVAAHLGYPVLLYDGSYEEWNRLNLPLTGPVVAPEKN